MYISLLPSLSSLCVYLFSCLQRETSFRFCWFPFQDFSDFSHSLILDVDNSLLNVVYQSLERETREETRVFTREQRADCIIKNRTESSRGIFGNLLPLFLHEFLLPPHELQKTKRACSVFGSCVTTIHSVRLSTFLPHLFRKIYFVTQSSIGR